MIHIYIRKNTVTNKYYVGQSVHPKYRWTEQLKSKSCPKLFNAIKKYGVESFQNSILFSTEDQDTADFMEEFLIYQFNSIRNGYNIKHGGCYGAHTEATKKKLSRILKGKIKSTIARQHMSLAHKGHFSPMQGKPHTLAAKIKNRVSHLDNHYAAKLTFDQVQVIRNLYTGKRGEISSIARIYKVSRDIIDAVVKGKSWCSHEA